MFEGQDWYEYLDEPMRDLVDESYYLLDGEQMRALGLHDYSFVVFPMAKAYEGFLKKFLFDIGLLSKKQVEARYFRLGKSLNPSLPEKLRSNTWVYAELEKNQGNLAEVLWNGWKMGRNKIFHYFVGHENFISLDEAETRIEMIRGAMSDAVAHLNLVKRK